jgi:hypothetical protein
MIDHYCLKKAIQLGYVFFLNGIRCPQLYCHIISPKKNFYCHSVIQYQNHVEHHVKKHRADQKILHPLTTIILPR